MLPISTEAVMAWAEAAMANHAKQANMAHEVASGQPAPPYVRLSIERVSNGHQRRVVFYIGGEEQPVSLLLQAQDDYFTRHWPPINA